VINPNDVDPMPEPDDGWADEDPIPLTQTAQIPPFPVDALPDPIADMVRGVSEATQTDPAMAATSTLSALSACTGGHAQIEIRPGWREPVNVYTATIAAPGERKSAVQTAMISPIFDVEQQLADASLGARLEAQTRKEVAESAAEKSKRDAANKANDDGWDTAMANAIGAAQIAADITVPVIPRIVADDTTPEAAATLLAEQGGRLAIISAEGGIFDIIAGRYNGNIPNLDLWLKGHSGDPLKIDRKNRPPEYVRQPAMTLGLMIQPEVLHTIAANRQFRGRGLLARFFYAYPQSKVGRRQIAPTPVPADVRERYETTVKDLASGMAGWLGDPAVLTLTPSAHEAIIAIETAVEPTLAGDGELAPLADWGAKYVGAVARIAGILHLAGHGPDVGPTSAVTAQTILAANRIGEYFKACAIRAFNEMGTDRVTADAIYLLERIERLGQDEVSERDLHVACKSRFKKKADLLPALDRLVEHGYLLPLPAAGPTGGRPASPRYRVHPVYTKGTEGT
jgi:replicative DNA helicase